MVDAYYFCIGGSVGEFASIAPSGRLSLRRHRRSRRHRAPPEPIQRASAHTGENLRQFFARHTNDDLRCDPRRWLYRFRRTRCRCNGSPFPSESKAKWARSTSSAQAPAIPNLLTVKAARLLDRATIVLHDSLVSREVLALIPATAEIIDVGKRAGQKLLTQDEINALLVSYAAQPRSRDSPEGWRSAALRPRRRRNRSPARSSTSHLRSYLASPLRWAQLQRREFR